VVEEEELCGMRSYRMVLFPTKTSYDQAIQMCADFNSKTGREMIVSKFKK
jgi:hypothetical protein